MRNVSNRSVIRDPRLRNDLICVEWDVKPYTLTHPRDQSLTMEKSWVMMMYCRLQATNTPSRRKFACSTSFNSYFQVNLHYPAFLKIKLCSLLIFGQRYESEIQEYYDYYQYHIKYSQLLLSHSDCCRTQEHVDISFLHIQINLPALLVNTSIDNLV